MKGIKKLWEGTKRIWNAILTAVRARRKNAPRTGNKWDGYIRVVPSVKPAISGEPKDDPLERKEEIIHTVAVVDIVQEVVTVEPETDKVEKTKIEKSSKISTRVRQKTIKAEAVKVRSFEPEEVIEVIISSHSELECSGCHARLDKIYSCPGACPVCGKTAVFMVKKPSPGVKSPGFLFNF